MICYNDILRNQSERLDLVVITWILLQSYMTENKH